MRAPLEHAEGDALLPRDVDQEHCALCRRRSELEVRRALARYRARTEKGSPQVGATAARTSDDPPRRPLEWSMACVQDSCVCEHAQRSLSSLQVQLEARGAVERPPAVRPDLRANPLVPEERECAPSDRPASKIEVEGPLPSPA